MPAQIFGKRGTIHQEFHHAVQQCLNLGIIQILSEFHHTVQ